MISIMRMRSPISLLVLLAPLLFAACQTEQRGVPLEDVMQNPMELLRNQKIAVVSIPRDPRVRARFESVMAEKMRKHGIDAEERAKLVPESDSLSPEDLRQDFAKLGMTSVIEFNYKPNEAMADGTPKTFRSTMISLLPKSSPAYRDGGSLNAAIIVLLMNAVK
jgi:hypothetical protein